MVSDWLLGGTKYTVSRQYVVLHGCIRSLPLVVFYLHLNHLFRLFHFSARFLLEPKLDFDYVSYKDGKLLQEEKKEAATDADDDDGGESGDEDDEEEQDGDDDAGGSDDDDAGEEDVDKEAGEKDDSGRNVF